MTPTPSMLEAMARAIDRYFLLRLPFGHKIVEDGKELPEIYADRDEAHEEMVRLQARAARKAALEWMEGNVDEGMVEAACKAVNIHPHPDAIRTVRAVLTAAIRQLSERSE